MLRVVHTYHCLLVVQGCLIWVQKDQECPQADQADQECPQGDREWLLVDQRTIMLLAQ